MENYNIRKIESRDDNAILNIVRSCFEEFGAPLTGSVYCDPRLEHLSREFEGENEEYWVIENEDKKVIGGDGFFPRRAISCTRGGSCLGKEPVAEGCDA